MYSIDSVDHALHLATILQIEGPLRVTDAAERLGVARSTAHRLLAMLVYRDFAEQDISRRYVAGPVLRRPTVAEPVAELRRIALPHMQALTTRLNETTNVVIVVGDQVRFLATVECTQVLRVGDREGRMLPAHLASGGRAVLAGRTDEEIAELYSSPDAPTVDLAALQRNLRRVRRMGFAMNNQETESGVTAIGQALHSGRKGVGAALSIAMPTVRYQRQMLPALAQALAGAVARVEADLRAASRV